LFGGFLISLSVLLSRYCFLLFVRAIWKIKFNIHYYDCFVLPYYLKGGRNNRFSNSLWAGRSRVRIPASARGFLCYRTVQIGFGPI